MDASRTFLFASIAGLSAPNHQAVDNAFLNSPSPLILCIEDRCKNLDSLSNDYTLTNLKHESKYEENVLVCFRTTCVPGRVVPVDQLETDSVVNL